MTQYRVTNKLCGVTVFNVRKQLRWFLLLFLLSLVAWRSFVWIDIAVASDGGHLDWYFEPSGGMTIRYSSHSDITTITVGPPWAGLVEVQHHQQTIPICPSFPVSYPLSRLCSRC